jgi:hypothetical protein
MSVPYKFTLRTFFNSSSTKVHWLDCFHLRKENALLESRKNHTHLTFTGSDSLTYVQQCLIFRKRESSRSRERERFAQRVLKKRYFDISRLKSHFAYLPLFVKSDKVCPVSSLK